MLSIKRMIAVGVVCMLTGSALAASSRAAAPPPPESGQAVWKLGHAYWRHVEKNDLSDYRKLWQ